jgi:hypothetical protein
MVRNEFDMGGVGLAVEAIADELDSTKLHSDDMFAPRLENPFKDPLAPRPTGLRSHVHRRPPILVD